MLHYLYHQGFWPAAGRPQGQPRRTVDADPVEALRETMNVRTGHEWDMFEGMNIPEQAARDFLKTVPFVQRGRRRFDAAKIAVPEKLEFNAQSAMSTQQGVSASSCTRLPAPIRRSHPRRHDLTRCYGLDQSRRMGQPARFVLAGNHGRSFQNRTHSLYL